MKLFMLCFALSVSVPFTVLNINNIYFKYKNQTVEILHRFYTWKNIVVTQMSSHYLRCKEFWVVDEAYWVLQCELV